MAAAQPIKTNFTAGELSPRLFGRVDIARYLNGAALLENFIILPHGGIIGRPGTKFAAEVKDSSAITRLMSFEFNEAESYIMEFGNAYVRFYSNDGAVLEAAKNITGATNANPGVITAVGHGYATGDDVVLENLGGMTQVNSKRFRVTVLTADTFSIPVDTTAYGVYTAGGTAKRVYTLTSPYTSAQLFGIQTAQSADVMYLAHRSVRVQKLARTAHTSWTFTAVDFVNGPYLPENTTATTLTMSAAGPGAGITVTASVGIFAATDVGRVLAFKHTAAYGWGRITGYTSPTVVTMTVVAAFDGTSAKTTWKLGAFSDTTGHPPALCFHEQRFWLGGPGARTQTLYGSVSADYENMAAGAAATDAIVYTIASDKVNPIRWLSPDKDIAVGTSGGEFIVTSGTQGEAITPSNITVIRQTTMGVDEIPPVRIGARLIFLQRVRRKLMDWGYKFEEDNHDADDITILSEHIVRQGVTDMAYQQEPNSNVWCSRDDGLIATLTYQRAQQVFGWSRSRLGGSFGGSNAVVESMGVIPDSDQDQIWMLVKRTIGGQTKRYIEYLTTFFYGDTEAEKKLAFQVDCGLNYNGAAVNVVTGADHLIGQTVGILADGKVQPDQVVAADGSITLANGLTASIITLGLKYTPKVKLLTFEPGNPFGTSQGKLARVTRISFRVFQSLGGWIGLNETGTLDQAKYNEDGETNNQSPPLKSGYIHQLVPAGFTEEPQAYFEQRDPLPITILSAMPEYKVHP